MKNKLVSLIIFVLLFLTYAQSQSFRKLYEGDFRSHGAIQNNDGNFYFGNGALSKMDGNGNQIWGAYQFDTILQTNVSYYCRLQKFDSAKIAFSALVFDTCFGKPTAKPTLSFYNFIGLNLKNKGYTLNGSCIALTNGLVIMNNKNILMHGGGSKLNSFQAIIRDAAFALCVDSTLENIIYAKYFNRKGNSAFAAESDNGSVILGINLDGIGPCITKLDSTGNILWCRSYTKGHGLITDGMVNADGTIMVVGYTDTLTWGTGPYPSWFYTKLLLMKIDSNGTVIWSKGYDDVHPYHWNIKTPAIIHKSPDGNYIVGATKNSSNTLVAELAYILKTDINGNLLFHNGFGYSNLSNNRLTRLYNFIPTLDSCILIIGNFQGGNSWAFGGSFAFKTDNNLTTTCGGNFAEPITTTNLFYNDSIVTLTSIDGATIDNPHVESLFGVMWNTMDDCILLSANTESTNTYHAPAFPNPTNGEVTVPSSKMFERDSYVTVYDSTGRIVIQYGIAGKQTLKFNLSKFGPGLYLIKINEQGKIRTEQVVVE